MGVGVRRVSMNHTFFTDKIFLMPLQKPSNRGKKAVQKATNANISIMRNSGMPAKRAIAAGLSITKRLTPKKRKK